MLKFIDENSKYRLILVILISVFFIVVALSLVASRIKLPERTNGTVAIVLNEGDLIVNYKDGNEISFNDRKDHNYALSITNNGGNKIYYSIAIQNPSNDDVYVEIQDEKGNPLKKCQNLKEDLVYLASVNGNETIRYNIYFPNDEKSMFKGNLKVTNESMIKSTFSDQILINNKIEQPTTRPGVDISTTPEGLIAMRDNKGVSYYFRGDIKNNYFRLNKMLFRIVRINGDNSVRLVLDDVLSTVYPYNINDIGSNPVSSLGVYENSSLNKVLMDWYNRVLAPYDRFITVNNYCSDNAFKMINNGNYSESYERIFMDKAPDLYCSGSVYSGKVGLLSIDEVILAGASPTKPNTKFYLYNDKIEGNYLTSSSYSINMDNDLFMMNVMVNGEIGSGINVRNNSSIRPVINISVDANVKGNGTRENPYIIVS